MEITTILGERRFPKGNGIGEAGLPYESGKYVSKREE